MAAPKYFAFLLTVSMCFFLLQNAGVRACNFEKNIGFVGADIKDIPDVNGPSACCLECRAVLGCSMYTYFNSGPQKNHCILKAAVDTVVNDTTATSGVSTGQCNFDYGYEYLQFTQYSVSFLPNHQMCCHFCAQMTKCVAFTYFKSGPLQGDCNMKFAINNKLPAFNAVSVTTSAGTCAYEAGFNYVGPEISTLAKILKKEDCCKACQKTPKCVAASYITSGPKANTCTLKSSIQNRSVNKDAVSGNGAKSLCFAK